MKTTQGVRAYLQGEQFEYLGILLISETLYMQI